MPAWIQRWKGKGFKNRLLHPHDEFWDRRLGVHTFGFIPAVGEPDDAAWQGHYQPTSYRDLHAMLEHARLGADDVYVDLGCGLGRTVFAAAAMGARRSVGVEIDTAFVRACRDSLRHSRLVDRAIEFIEAPAQDYPHRETTLVFMFHPFGRGTLQAVLDGLRAELARAPRPLRLVYFNAVSDDLLAASGFLRCVARWEPGVDWRPSTGAYAASFWEAVDAGAGARADAAGP